MFLFYKIFFFFMLSHLFVTKAEKLIKLTEV